LEDVIGDIRKSAEHSKLVNEALDIDGDEDSYEHKMAEADL